ncbi:hypothetical protein PENDEC_c012G06481 [Penicillium decumbens]|uniref:Acylphosphatase-like domain-containing protein n=1 Tax=Penicillium decumbens TaxID=69771 RepID=A0A1V6PBP4_PENDC|nr:hypothetical protein PENDEC_c012G06481 [Penicillium decumbens]
MSIERVSFKVHGAVQGVGFRDFTQKCAASHGLVEGQVQGDGAAVGKFLQQINKGPRTAHVVKVETNKLQPDASNDAFVLLKTADSTFSSGSQD